MRDVRARPKFMRDYLRDHPPRERTGLIPLTDLGAGRYADHLGGLYPEGRNAPSPGHLQAGLLRSARVMPRGPDGEPHPQGLIGLLAVGMSNVQDEMAALIEQAAARDDLNPALRLVNGAQRHQPADVMAAGDPGFWGGVTTAVERADLRPAQVQAVWLKSALRGPRAPFPAEAERLRDCLRAAVLQLVERFPRLALVYLSSRSYAGYSEIPLSPEPFAYEDGFAVRWVIEQQIAGSPELRCGPEHRCPWIGWGPYLWADGLSPRKSDGLTYRREDMAWDGAHPSPAGSAKVARQLMQHFTSDPTAVSWFMGA